MTCHKGARGDDSDEEAFYRKHRQRLQHGIDLYTNEPAATRVGRIEEVIRRIVLHLDTNDLARARRVSQTWKSEIEHWPKWQEWLFQTSVVEREHLLWEQDRDDRDKRHATLKHNLHEDALLYSTAVEVHPLLAPNVFPWDYTRTMELIFGSHGLTYLLEIDTACWRPTDVS